MTSELLKITCADGVELPASKFLDGAGRQDRGTLLIAPALGVPRKVYAKLATYFASEGYAVISFDYRGSHYQGKHNGHGNRYENDHNDGEASTTALPAAPRLHEWGSMDLDAAIEFASARYANQPLYLMGHSIGGQLTGLAKSADKLSGMILVAASFPYWKRWPVPARYSIGAMFFVLIPLLCRLRKNFRTALLGLGSIEYPSSLIADWSRWIRKENYLLDPQFGFDAEAYRQLSLPVLAYGFSDDSGVPEASMDKLLAAHSGCDIDRRFINVAQNSSGAVGHMGYFRDTHQTTLWADTLQWLNNRGRYIIAKGPNIPG